MFLLSMRRFLLPALVACALLAPAGAHAQTTPDPNDPSQAMAGDTMWIWQVKKSSRGSVSRIARAAKRYGIENLVVKGADATRTWRQFNRGFVNALRARGLKVCAYQFVYGRRPRGEAIAGGPHRQGGRLPGHRRGDPLRGPLRLGPGLHAQPARAHRARTTRSA